MKPPISLQTAFAALITWAAQAEAFWRLPCRAQSGIARLDPLQAFGGIGSHVHLIFGSDSTFSMIDP